MSSRTTIRGASLIEVAVALSIISVMAFGLGAMITSAVDDARVQAALDQLDRIKKGTVGETRVIAPGDLQLARFGYIGDIGGLPTSVQALVEAGSQPNYSFDSVLQKGAGWRGPYVPTAPTDFTIDPWDNPIVITVAAGTSALTGAPTVATIKSLGPDGTVNTADDLVVEIYKSETFSDVFGYVKDFTHATLADVTVKLTYASAGAVVTTPPQLTDTQGRYQFTNIPHGSASIQLEPKLMMQRGSAVTTGLFRNNMTFVIENLHKDAVNVTSLKMTYTSSPTAYYREVWLNGVKVFDNVNPRAASGTTITFSTRTINGTGVIQEPIQVQMSSLVSQLPDTTIGTIGTGGTLKIDLMDFDDSSTGNSGNPVDVTGVTFEATFSEGSQTLATTVFAPRRQ